MNVLLKCTIALLMASMSISCGRNDASEKNTPIEKLAVSKEQIQIIHGKTETLQIFGSGSYKITLANNNLITSILTANNILELTSIDLGETTINIKDKKTGKSVDIQIACITDPKKYTLSNDGTILEKWHDDNLTSLDMEKDPILKKVKTLDNGLFHNKKKLNKITLPKGLKTIKNSVFLLCESLQEITIPKNVTDMSGNSIFDTSGIRKIYILATTPPKISAKTFRNNGEVFYGIFFDVFVPSASLEKYKQAEFYNSQLGNRLKTL